MMAVETVTEVNAVIAVRREIRAAGVRSLLRSIGRSSIIGIATLAIVLAIWMGVLWAFNISPYIAKGPADVWNYLFNDPKAGANRVYMGKLLGVTMSHAFIGFVAGMVVATVGAILFRLSKGIENALMPIAMLLRSVPLIAMAPVILLIFGNGSVSVAVIGGIVVLFPALVSIAFGLNSASPQILDVVSVYGGNTMMALRKVALPASLPSFFAALRISVPGAITGALLAEWLATGDGIGGAIQTYPTQALFTELWTAVVLVTFVSLLLYSIVQLIENIVLNRMGMTEQGSRSS